MAYFRYIYGYNSKIDLCMTDTDLERFTAYCDQHIRGDEKAKEEFKGKR